MYLEDGLIPDVRAGDRDGAVDRGRGLRQLSRAGRPVSVLHFRSFSRHKKRAKFDIFCQKTPENTQQNDLRWRSSRRGRVGLRAGRAGCRRAIALVRALVGGAKGAGRMPRAGLRRRITCHVSIMFGSFPHKMQNQGQTLHSSIAKLHKTQQKLNGSQAAGSLFPAHTPAGSGRRNIESGRHVPHAAVERPFESCKHKQSVRIGPKS